MVVCEVEKPINELRPAAKVLSHVVEPVCINVCDRLRLLLNVKRHPERVEPQGRVGLFCVVVQCKQLHPCRRTDK